MDIAHLLRYEPGHLFNCAEDGLPAFDGGLAAP